MKLYQGASLLSILVFLTAGSQAWTDGWFNIDEQALLAFTLKSGGTGGLAIRYRTEDGCKPTAVYFTTKARGDFGRQLKIYHSDWYRNKMIWDIDGAVYSGYTTAVKYENGFEVSFLASNDLLRRLQSGRILTIHGLRSGSVIITHYEGLFEATRKAKNYCVVTPARR